MVQRSRQGGKYQSAKTLKFGHETGESADGKSIWVTRQDRREEYGVKCSIARDKYYSCRGTKNRANMPIPNATLWNKMGAMKRSVKPT